MSFLKDLFHKKECAESVVLIDITADSVAGAYALYKKKEIPTLLYTRRVSAENRVNEPREGAVLRALAVLGGELIREGAPVLMRATGSGSADKILVSVNAPWQETSVRTEHFERATPFVFTKSMVATALEKADTVPPGKVLTDESIITSILNGYETHNPYGKEVHRASLVILTSFFDKSISESISSMLRGLFHTKHIRMIAGGSLRYQAIRAAFPHEHRPDTSSLKQALDAADSGKLWLSGHPPKVVPVLASHIVGLVRQTATTSPDLQLLLMALYYHQYQHYFSDK